MGDEDSLVCSTSPFENSLHGQITHCECKHIIGGRKNNNFWCFNKIIFFAIADER